MRPTRIREIKMKKQLFLASALSIALTSQAQILTLTNNKSDRVEPIPGMFTCNGKSRMANYFDDEESEDRYVRIYNENLEVEKEFGFVQSNIGRYSVTKQRELVWKNMPEYDKEIKDTVRLGIDLPPIKEITVDDIRNILEWRVGTDKWMVITEASRTATSVSFNVDVNKDLLEFQNYDGHLSGHYYIGTITCSVFDVNPQYTTISGTLKYYGPSFTGDWNKWETSDVQYDSESIFDLSYCDMTLPFDNKDFTITQNLFKEDEAYEYIVPICQQFIERTDNYDLDGDGEVDKVVTQYGISYPGFKIMQDNGNVLATIMFDGGYTFNSYSWASDLRLIHFENKNYIAANVQKKNSSYDETEYATIFYAITPGDATSIKAVRTEYNGIKATPALAHKNETVVVDFSGIENAKLLSVVNGNGRTVMQTHVTNGQTSYTLNTSDLPAGLYVVKVDNGKNTTETCKIVVR